MSTNRVLGRFAFGAAAVGTLGLLGAGVAGAHVTANVYGEPAEQGGYGAIVLRVPNEEADAGTTKLEVTIPPEYALSSVRTKPVPGWAAEVTKTKLPEPVRNGRGAEVGEVATKITWTAQGGTKIAAGSTEYQEFPFTVGPLPEVDTLVLAAAQTYENGKVVNWNAPPPENGGEEPEHPAPVVPLAESSGDGHGAKPAAKESQDSAAATPGHDHTARWLGGVGLGLGALGLGLGAGALLRSRRSVAAPAEPKDDQ